MNYGFIDPNVKRGKNVVLWSLLYLIATWLAAVIGLVIAQDDSLAILGIFDLLFLPPYICAFIFAFLWVRSLMITARYIQPAGIGYRQGWAFWGWVTPFASFWIPKRLITRTYECFIWYTQRPNTLVTDTWWTLFVITSVIDWFSFRAGAVSNMLSAVLDFVSAVMMTIAFPHWKRVVETVSDAQAETVQRLMTPPQQG